LVRNFTAGLGLNKKIERFVTWHFINYCQHPESIYLIN